MLKLYMIYLANKDGGFRYVAPVRAKNPKDAMRYVLESWHHCIQKVFSDRLRVYEVAVFAPEGTLGHSNNLYRLIAPKDWAEVLGEFPGIATDPD